MRDRHYDALAEWFTGHCQTHDARFHRMVTDGLEGYDLSMTGKMVFPPKPVADQPIVKEAV